jgi:hypothetical protein
VQGDIQPLADLLIRTALGDQFEHCQLTPTETVGAGAGAFRQGRQTRQQGLLHGARWTPQQLLAQPLRLLLKDDLQGLQGAVHGPAQTGVEQPADFLLAAILQQQADQLSLGLEHRQVRAAPCRRDDQLRRRRSASSGRASWRASNACRKAM